MVSRQPAKGYAVTALFFTQRQNYRYRWVCGMQHGRFHPKNRFWVLPTLLRAVGVRR